MKRILVLLCWILLISFTLISIAQAEDFPKLDEAIPGNFVSQIAPVFDFDGDGCLPSAGISRDGEQNEGLSESGDLTSGCRSNDFLNTSNTLHRHACVTRDSHTYCGHFYALYFEKDVCEIGGVSYGHRHDWEYAAVWTVDGTITHGSCSGHGELDTRAVSDLPLQNGHMKIVYHREGLRTHSLRFADPGEVAENPYGAFVTPTLISWDNLIGDGICNEKMREKLNSFNYGEATIPLIDMIFLMNLNSFKPEGYPDFVIQMQKECQVTYWFSEENVEQICPPGHVVTGITCYGEYCDLKQLVCCKIPGLILEGDPIYSPWFSEEGTNFIIRDDYAVIGMACLGSYCDSISLLMKPAYYGKEGYTWTPYFSDYAQGHCDSGYVGGVQCAGDYCDNLRLYCKQAYIADSDNDGLPDYYENEHGFDSSKPEDAVLDADNDGFSNLREYISGTDPENSESIPPFYYDLDCDLDVDGSDLIQFILEGVFDEQSLLFFSEDFGRN